MSNDNDFLGSDEYFAWCLAEDKRSRENKQKILQAFQAIMEEEELDDIEEVIDFIGDQLYPLKVTDKEIRKVIQPYFAS